jgi:hypothetical protein
LHDTHVPFSSYPELCHQSMQFLPVQQPCGGFVMKSQIMSVVLHQAKDNSLLILCR